MNSFFHENTITIRESDTRLIQSRLMNLNLSQHFFSFDHFMLEEWLEPEDFRHWKENFLAENTDEAKDLELRKKAFQIFFTKVKKDKIASRNTILTWFGIGKLRTPKRKHIFYMAVALHFTEEMLQKYLKQGLLETGVQINDYQEAIYLYACKKGISLSETQDMIEIFEKNFICQKEYRQVSHTSELWNMFRENENKEPEDFLLFMCKNMTYFKGYSMTAIKVFLDYKEEILNYVREDAKMYLYDALKETDFFEWMISEGIDKNDWESHVKRYLKNTGRRKGNKSVSAENKDLIGDLHWIVSDSKGRNTDMLAEIYASAIVAKDGNKKQRIVFRDRSEFALPREISFMSNKYVSLLLGIATQKEKEIRLLHTMTLLNEFEDSEFCPDSIREFLFYFSGKEAPKKIKEVKKVLTRLIIDQRNRCTILKREDLLPLIQYAAQRRYRKMMQDEYSYHASEAINLFKELANHAMQLCQMDLLNEKYHMDYLLLSCYGKEEMYTMSDVIEESMNIEL